MEKELLNRRFRWMAATWLIWLCCQAVVAAEEGDTSGPSGPAGPAAPSESPGAPQQSSRARVEEVHPSIYYLPDKEGNLQAVLDFSYEDFVELYKLKQRLDQAAERPRYTIERISIDGAAGADNAELSVRLQIAIRDADWTRVPLRLDQGLLREPAEHGSACESFLDFRGEGEGYVLWIRGAAGLHEFALKMLVPLSRAGDETKLKLSTPRAAVAEMKLQVPQAEAAAKTSEGSRLVSAAAGEKGGTLLTVLGLGGEFQLAWHEPGERAAEAPPVFEACGAILARIDDQAVTSEAVLTVRSYGDPPGRFVVRLPQDFELVSGDAKDYTVSALEAKKEPAERGLVEVRLLNKAPRPIEVRLSARRSFAARQPPEELDLGGFDVAGAARQWGTIAVAASAERQLIWGAQKGVRQIDVLPENIRKQGVTAGFEYYAQPFALSLRLAPLKPHINLEPEYVLLVNHDKLQLEARLACFVRGAKLSVLRLAMPDWEIDDAQPENLVAAEGIACDDAGLVSLPLRQPTAGKLELRLRAHRMLDRSSDVFSVAMPVPQGLSQSPALVAVVPADNVELAPDAKAIEGLVRQQAAAPLKLPSRQQDALFYRGEGPQSRFAARLRVHPRRVTVDAASYVQLQERSASVEERLIYTIAYEAADHLLIDVPRPLAGPNCIEMRCAGKPASAKIVGESGGDAVAPGTVRMRVGLPEPTIGRCELDLKFSAVLPALDTSLPASWSVPLVVPAGVELTGNKMHASAAQGVTIIGHDDAWEPAESPFAQAGQQTALELICNSFPESLDLDVRREDRLATNTTIIERAWIQTSLSSTVRQDRAAYKVSTNQPALGFRLPAGAVADQALVSLDGKRVEAQPAGENQFSIALGGRGEIGEHVLELQYRFSGPRPPPGALSLDFPRIGAGAWTGRMYWQLVVPQNEHVLMNPAGFVGEYFWKWGGYYWGREPLLNQSQLETWIGASRGAAVDERAGVYLYGVLGNADYAQLRTFGRTWIVIIASGAALVFGLLLIYAPPVRHPLTLLVAGLALLSLAMIYPEPAAMIAQASGLGLAMTLVAGLLERGMARRRKQAMSSGRSVVIGEMSSSRAVRPSSQVGVAGSSTKALPAQSQSLPQEPPA